jgi:hypothetical protein
MTEKAVMALPDGFELAGLSAGARGELLAWARGPNFVLRLGPSLVREVSWVLPDSIRPLAIASRGDGIEVVATEPPTLHRFDLEGASRGATALNVEGILLAAARGDDAWYVMAESLEGIVTVRLYGRAGYAIVARYGALTPDAGGLWVTATTHPFAVWRLRDDWSQGITLHPPAQVLDSMRVAAGQRDFTMWGSLPLVVLDRGYLQTIADLEEDRRLIVVYDRGGNVLTSLAIDVPIGIMAAASGRRRVYAARRTNSLEIVEYSYEWESASGSRPAREARPSPVVGGPPADARRN